MNLRWVHWHFTTIWYCRLYLCHSVFLPFHINQVPVVNQNVLYIFTEYDKYRCWIKSSNNTPQRHITAYRVQFNGAFVKKLKVDLFVRFYRTLKFPWHIGNDTLKQFTLKYRNFFKESYMWIGITAKPYSGSQSCHIHLLVYPLSQHLKFQKIPVSLVRWINILILMTTETVDPKMCCVLWHWKIRNEIKW